MINKTEIEHIINISPAVFFSIKNIKSLPVVYISENISQFGFSVDEFYNNQITIQSIIVPEDYEKVKADYKTKVNENNNGFSQNYRILTQNGEKIWVEVYNWIRRNKDKGNIEFYEGFFINIDKRVKAEIELSQSQKKCRDINNSLMDGYVEIDMDGFIRDFNPAFQKMIGYDENEILKLTWKDITPKDWHEREKKILNEQVLMRGYSEIYEKEYICKNGAIFPVELRAYLLKNEDNKPEGMWAIVRDITERKKTLFQRDMLISKLEKSAAKEAEIRVELENKQDELKSALVLAEESNHLKNEFLTIISHELRTPLHGILGYAQLLVEDKTLNKEQNENADFIFQSGERLMTVLNELLDISLIDACKSGIKNTLFDVKEIINDIYILLRNKFNEKNIAFTFDLHGIEKIKSDPARVRQIILHLVGNAIKFSDSGTVKIELEIQNREYIFKVIDTGIGINEENKNLIFDLFTQIELSINRKHDGIGLGLPICKKLVYSLEGKIWLESEIGKGSIFYFSIPQSMEE